MRNEADPEENRAAAIASPMPWRVVEVRALPDYRLRVRFIDGTEGEVNVAPLVTSASPGVFAALRNADVFNAVHIDHGAVTWPGELDLAPDAMYDAIKSSGSWTPY